MIHDWAGRVKSCWLGPDFDRIPRHSKGLFFYIMGSLCIWIAHIGDEQAIEKKERGSKSILILKQNDGN